MNRPAHMLIGAGVGVLTYYVGSKLLGMQPTWGPAILFAGVGAAMACMADELEPALSPHHRAFFHSVACNSAIAVGVRYLWRNPSLRPGEKLACAVLGFSYISHPLIDATTPMGLPLI